MGEGYSERRKLKKGMSVGKSGGPRKRVERRKSGEVVYLDRTLRQTRAIIDLEANPLVPPDYRRKFPEPMWTTVGGQP